MVLVILILLLTVTVAPRQRFAEIGSLEAAHSVGIEADPLQFHFLMLSVTIMMLY